MSFVFVIFEGLALFFCIARVEPEAVVEAVDTGLFVLTEIMKTSPFRCGGLFIFFSYTNLPIFFFASFTS